MCTDNFKALSIQSEAVTALGFFLFTDKTPPKTNEKQKVVAIKMAQNRNFPDKSCNC